MPWPRGIYEKQRSSAPRRTRVSEPEVIWGVHSPPLGVQAFLVLETCPLSRNPDGLQSLAYQLHIMLLVENLPISCADLGVSPVGRNFPTAFNGPNPCQPQFQDNQLGQRHPFASHVLSQLPRITALTGTWLSFFLLMAAGAVPGRHDGRYVLFVSDLGQERSSRRTHFRGWYFWRFKP